MNDIKTGIIGIGGIGALHGEWLEKCGGFSIAALADANEAMRQKATEKFPAATFYTEVSAMLQREKLDLIVIASPHFLHAPLAIQCLQAGVNVMVEKPMATTHADCLAMIDAAREAGKSLTVFHNRRLDPWFLAAQSAVQAGKLGPLIRIETAWPGRPSGRQKLSWRSYHQASGGLLFDFGAHLIDQLLHFETSEVLSVSGFQYRPKGEDPALNEHHAEVHLRFASGTFGQLTISDLIRVNPHRYLLVGEDATLQDEWNWNGGNAKIFSGSGEGDYEIEQIAYEKEGVNLSQYHENLRAHLRDGTPLLVTAESAARVIQIIESAQISHASGGIPISLH